MRSQTRATYGDGPELMLNRRRRNCALRVRNFSKSSNAITRLGEIRPLRPCCGAAFKTEPSRPNAWGGLLVHPQPALERPIVVDTRSAGLVGLGMSWFIRGGPDTALVPDSRIQALL